MNSDSNLDRESFQQLLASAFAVQESQIDSQLLSGIMDVQRLIARGELGTDAAMHLIVDSARDVANAAGVAIGVLEDDHLIYRAGSGSSASYLGSRVTASLTVSPNIQARREILRVENAETDTRIEGAICRQFGAKSILILPIYHERTLGGVLEILFSEAHVFEDREVRTYRLMVGLIEASILQASKVARKKNPASERSRFPQTFERSIFRSGRYLEEKPSVFAWADKYALYDRCSSAVAGVRESRVFRQSVLLASTMVQRAKESTSDKPRRNAALGSLATVLVFGCWIAYSSRGPASSSTPSSSTPAGSTAIQEQGPIQPENTVPAEGTYKRLPTPVPVNEARAAVRVRPVRMGQIEIAHFGDDVTVRHFIYKPAPQHRVGTSRVAYIGDDVTVRYFSPKPATGTQQRR